MSTITQRDVKAFKSALSHELTLEFVCRPGDDDDVWYRRALLQNHPAKLTDAQANAFMEKVFGRFDHADPLAQLMSEGKRSEMIRHWPISTGMSSMDFGGARCPAFHIAIAPNL